MAGDRYRPTRPDAALPAHWRAAVVEAMHGGPASDGVDLDEALVHALRRNAKLVRALVRLAPASLDVLAADTTRTVDALRRSLGDLRDGAVRRQTFNRLAEQGHLSASDFESVLQPARPWTEGHALPPRVPRELASLARSWARCDLSAVRNDAIIQALARSYGRARHRAKGARAGDTRAVHRWRRTIVDLHLQLGTFAGGSHGLRKLAKQMNGLRDLLGQVHDIDALLAQAERAGTPAGEALVDLHTVGGTTRKRLLAEIDRDGQRAFADDPERWSDGIAGALHASLRALEAGAPSPLAR